jgi:hypothetical protein
MSNKELILTTAKEIFLKLLDQEDFKVSLKLSNREADFSANLERLEKAFLGVMQMTSKAADSIPA